MVPVRIGGGRLVEFGSGDGGGDINIEDVGDATDDGLGMPVPDPDTTSG